MAFATTTSTQLGPAPIGPYRIISGTFTNGATDVGGDITTGFNAIIACGAWITSHIGSQNPKFTVSGGTITLVTESGTDGNWWAIGR
jgi:hypothetical protein